MIDVPKLERDFSEANKSRGEEKLHLLLVIQERLVTFEKAAAVNWETISLDTIRRARVLQHKVTGRINLLEAAVSRSR